MKSDPSGGIALRQAFQDVACPVCGCVCDDLTVTVEDGRITAVEPPCPLAEPWFLAQHAGHPPARIAGCPVELDAAVAEAASILRGARAPLIYGLSRSSTGGQRAAVRLADLLGATIDTTASRCHGPSIMALQEVGESTCTLGEIRERADLVIYWGVDPLESHPRHLQRYAVEPLGRWVPRGRDDRRLVVVDVRPTATAGRADKFLQIAAGRDLEVLWTLRAIVRGLAVDPRYDAGAPLAELRQLADWMASCRCGVVFFGLGLARLASGHRDVEALLRLVRDLNGITRFHARRMRVPGDVAGADSVLCWQTGFPFSVNLARGYPRYNPGEYSANELLARREADACLLVGSEGVVDLSDNARTHLQSIPIMVLDYPSVESPWEPAVRFTTGVHGVHLPGTAYRMDEVPIPLRPVVPSPYPSDEDVLREIIQRLRPAATADAPPA